MRLLIGIIWLLWCGPLLAATEAIPLRDPERVVFFALGDQGSGSPHQKRVAEAMEQVAAARGGVDFVVLLGDNFYPNGVLSVTDPLWSAAFESIYTGAFLAKTPFLAVLGNHDIRSDPEAQVLYGREHLGSGRWRMRARQDSLDFGIAEKRPLLRLVLLDSTLPVEEQSRFASGALSAGSPVWRVVAAHYPLRSSGEHGSTRKLLDELLPVLQSTATDAYLCGHDHHMEVIRLPGEPLQVISGAGGHVLYRVKERLPGSEFALQGRYGFAQVEVGRQEMLVTMFDDRGAVLHRSRVGR
ncbi:MAG: metallophosphoesterase [Magnetococcales bacterium]|nr:metallophosphoesterase [Magnetococcales bacterium]